MGHIGAVAKRVSNALTGLSNNNVAIEKFAGRVARSLTLYEAGFERQGPIGSFLFLVPPQVSCERMCNTLAEELFGGTTWDGRPAFFKVDCSGFTSHDPRVLIPLVGGPVYEQGARRMFVVPQLAQITYPHFAVRAKKFLRDVANWNEWFLKDLENDLKELRFRRKLDEFYERLTIVIDEEQRQYHEELGQESPFLSVVVFEAVSPFIYPGLITLIRNVIQQGSVTVWPNQIVDFSHSLVLIIVYDEAREIGKELGFARDRIDNSEAAQKRTAEDKKQKERYTAGRRKLSAIHEFTGLVQAMGDNLYVLPSKTFDDQRTHILVYLAEAQKRLADRGITIEWSDEFIDACVKDTEDEAFRSYTDGRLRTAIDKHILYPIAQLLLSRRLKQGARLGFSVVGGKDTPDPGVTCEVYAEGQGEVLTPHAIALVWKKKDIGAEQFDQQLLEHDERIKRIHAKALEIFKQL